VTPPQQVWQVLGIAPTSDQSLIRKAYAARLKETHPEEDPAGFQRLRMAYEAAIQVSKGAARPTAGPGASSIGTPAEMPIPALQKPSPDAAAPAPEQRALEEALAHVGRMLKGEEHLEPAEFEAALEAVLTNPRAFHVGDWRVVESRVAQMMLESLPRSDAVASIVVRRFDWMQADAAGRRPKEVLAVMSRAADLEIVAKLREGTGNDARVFRLLSRPAPKRWIVRRFNAIFLDQAVREFLQRTLPARPSLANWLDQTSSAAWLKIFGRPHLSKRALIAMPIYSAIAVTALLIAVAHGSIPDGAVRPALVLALCAGPLLALGKLYAFSWPSHLLLVARKGRTPPMWVRCGWSPASALLVIAASAPEAGSIAWIAGIAAVLGTLCLLVWATVASSPVFVAEGLSFSQKLRFSFARNFLMIYWTCLIAAGVGLPAAIATAGALSASAIADLSLRKIWLFDTPRPIRLRLTGALFLLVAAAFYLLWWAVAPPAMTGLIAALVTASVLLHRPLQALFARAAQREFVAIYSGLMIVSVLNRGHVGLRLPGSCLLAGVALIIVLSVYREIEQSRDRSTPIDSPGPLSRFFDRDSALLPAATGLMLMLVGAYGLLFVSNYQRPDWVLYGALTLGGLYVLKRTFASAD
jgi:hypothetical protein